MRIVILVRIVTAVRHAKAHVMHATVVKCKMFVQDVILARIVSVLRTVLLVMYAILVRLKWHVRSAIVVKFAYLVSNMMFVHRVIHASNVMHVSWQ